MKKKLLVLKKKFLTLLKIRDWKVWVGIGVSGAALAILLSFVLIIKDLPAPAELTNRPLPQSTKILDRNGKLIYNIFVSENRTVIPLSDIPK